MNTSNANKASKSSGLLGKFQHSKGPLIVIILSAVLFTIAVLALAGYFFFFSPKDGGADRPLVMIHSPRTGAEL